MAPASDDGEMKLRHKMALVLLVSIGLTLVSGKVRGPEPDRWASNSVAWLQEKAFTLLSEHCCRPGMAAAIVGLISFTVFSLAVLAAGDLCRRLMCLSEFVVESDLGRRRGRKVAGAAVGLGYSVPIALCLAVTAKSNLALYSALYFAVSYAFVLLSTDPRASKATLTVHARFRNALSRGSERERRAADADDLAGEL